MGKIVDINERRKKVEADKGKNEAQTEFDIVEDIRGLFKNAKPKQPSLEVVEDGEEIDEGGFARFMAQVQNGEFSK